MADGSICDHCGENTSDHLRITIFNTGSKVQYTIPSSPVFTGGLTKIKLQFLPEEGGQNSAMLKYPEIIPTFTIISQGVCRKQKWIFYRL